VANGLEKNKKYFESALLIASFLFLLQSCATQYRFMSQPSEATVFFVNGSQKTMIGQTPIDFSKAALPTDAPFVITFEKSGFETKEISVAPSENTLTTINVSLKPALGALTDEATKRTRKSVQQIFAIQELTAQKRYVDALASLKKLEEAEPNLVEVFVMRGSIYVLLNDTQQARREWEKALKMDPSMESLKVRLLTLAKDDTTAKGSKP
jgi:tetratricopeptide (TPR) repeat protein